MIEDTNFIEWALNEIKIRREQKSNVYYALYTDEFFDKLEELVKSNDQIELRGLCFMLSVLCDRIPLTPVTDEEDQWEKVEWNYSDNDKNLQYEHKRNPSLFKTIMEDGSVRLTDVDRVRCNEPDAIDEFEVSNSFVTRVIDELYPITFPYQDEDIRVRINERAIGDGKDGLLAISSASRNGGSFKPINRYYKFDGKKLEWTQIDAFAFYNISSQYDTEDEA